jgi:hypothetical protein
VRRAVLVVAVVAVGLVLATSAAAKRAPSLIERAAITKALPASLRNVPVGCVWLDVAVSRSGGYAEVSPTYLNALHLPCVRYAANGDFFLRKRSGVWRVVFTGSEVPPCSLRVPRDLSSCRS